MKSSLCLGVLAVASLSLAAQEALAYNQLGGGPCAVSVGSPIWRNLPSNPTTSSRFVAVRRLCRSEPTLPFMPTISSLNDAQGWAYWMWSREGQSRIVQWVDVNNCYNDGAVSGNDTWFTGNSDGVNSGWYSSAGSLCPSQENPNAVWGACSVTRNSCIPFGGREIYEVETAARIGSQGATAAFFVSNTGERRNCMRIQQNVAEQLLQHEIGHTYGLAHNDAWLTMMNSIDAGAHHCVIGAGFRSQPNSDETSFMHYEYGRANGVVNQAGFPMWRDQQSGLPRATTETQFVLPFGQNTTVTIPQEATRFTFENHRACPSNSYPLTFRWVLIDENIVSPTIADAEVFSVWYTLSQCWPGLTYPFVLDGGWTISSQSLVQGRIYRLYAHVDVWHGPETDEGDNLVMLGPTVVRP